jgi:hypothetical protein
MDNKTINNNNENREYKEDKDVSNNNNNQLLYKYILLEIQKHLVWIFYKI